MDVLRWGNLTYWNLDASIEPVESFEVGARYSVFTRTEMDILAALIMREQTSARDMLVILVGHLRVLLAMRDLSAMKSICTR